MPKKPETKFKDNRVWPDLKKLKRSYFRKIQNRTVRGLPDFFGCVNGYFVALELKASDKEILQPLQRWNIEEILHAGGLAVPVTPENWAEVYETLVRLDSGEVNLKNLQMQRGPLSS